MMLRAILPRTKPDLSRVILSSVGFLSLALHTSAGTCAMASNPVTERECFVRILKPVHDDVGNQWLPGKTLPVDIEREDQNGVSYCAHGGSCVPKGVAGQSAAVLLNCRVGNSLGHGDRLLVPVPHNTAKP